MCYIHTLLYNSLQERYHDVKMYGRRVTTLEGNGSWTVRKLTDTERAAAARLMAFCGDAHPVMAVRDENGARQNTFELPPHIIICFPQRIQ